MPKYYGCPCEGCGAPLTLKDDIVVCPDCGAPYHRTCYEKLGRCIHAPAHNAGYEWKFPYKDAELRTCPACGERTLRSEANCRCCGAALPPETAEQPNDRAAAQSEQTGSFDYASFYRQQFEQQASDPLHQNIQAAFGRDEVIDGIASRDWMDYIGSAWPAYLESFSRMELQHSKISVSFSALLFGPFYFFYRKAWKPGFAFLAAEMLMSLPTLIMMLQISESPLAPAISSSALVVLSRILSAFGLALTLVRGLFGKWFYRRSAAAQIKRICTEFPDPEKRRAVLAAQGGVSFAAVAGVFALLMVFGAFFSVLLGPNLQALINALY